MRLSAVVCAFFLFAGILRGEKVVLRFIQLTDTEVSGNEKPAEWGRAVSDHMQKEPVDFLLLTGDLSSNTDAGLNFMANVLKQKRFGKHLHFSIGNHDFTESRPADRRFRELFGPLWYSFELKGVHFAVTPMIWSGQGQAAKRPVSYTKADFLQWLKKDLESLPPGTPVILINHDCFLNDPEICRYLKPERFNIKAFLCGHTHFNRRKVISGIPVYTTGCFSKGGNGSPASFAVYELTGSGALSRKIRHPGYARFSTPPDPRRKWESAETPGCCIFAAPLLHRDTVLSFVSDEAEAEQCGVYAFDRRTGEKKWFFRTENSLKSGGAIRQEALFVCDIDENLYCIDLKKGTLRWKKKLRTSGDSMYMRGCVIFQDKVIAGSADSLSCLRCADGSMVWRAAFPAGRADIYGYRHTLCDGILLTGGAGCECAGVDAETGKILWQLPVRKSCLGSPPFRIGGAWFAVRAGDTLCKFDPVSGKVLSRKRIPAYSSWLRHAPRLWDGSIVLGSRKHGLLFCSPDRLKPVGQFYPGKAILSTTPYFQTDRKMVDSELLIWRNKLIFSGADGRIYCLEPGSRKLAWSIAVGDAVAGLTLAGDELYAATFSGKIIRYQLQEVKNES